MIGGALKDEKAARLYYTKLIDSTKDVKVRKARN